MSRQTSKMHNAVKNMFGNNRGAQTSTTGIGATFENMSTATEQLLLETAKGNKAILDVLQDQTKILKKLGGAAGDGFGLEDWVLGGMIFKKIRNMFAAFKSFGAVKWITELTRFAMTGPQRIGSAISKSLGGITTLFTGRIASIAKSGFGAIMSAGRVIGNVFSRLSSVINVAKIGEVFAGLTRTMSSIGRSLGGIGKVVAPLSGVMSMIPRILSKLALPLVALMGVVDGIKGALNSETILGEGKDSIVDRLVSGLGAAINGLLFGIPDWLAKKVFNMDSLAQVMSYGLSTANRVLRDMADNVWGFVSGVGDNLKNLFTNMLDSIPTPMEMLDAIPNIGAAVLGIFKGVWDSVVEGVTGLGKAIKDAVTGFFADLGGGIWNMITGGGGNEAPSSTNTPNSAYVQGSEPATRTFSQPTTVTSAPQPTVMVSSVLSDLSGIEAEAESVQNEIIAQTDQRMQPYMQGSLDVGAVTGAKIVETVSVGISDLVRAQRNGAAEEPVQVIKLFGVPQSIADRFPPATDVPFSSYSTGGTGGGGFSVGGYNPTAPQSRGTPPPTASNMADTLPTGSSSAPPTAASAPPGSVAFDSPVQTRIYNTLSEAGYSDMAIAAVMAHAQNESNLNPEAYNPNDVGMPAAGLFQWRDSRLAGLEAFAAERGTTWKDLDTQIAYFMKEMGSTEDIAYGRLMAASTLEEASLAMSRFERFAGHQNPRGRENLERIRDTGTYYNEIADAKQRAAELESQRQSTDLAQTVTEQQLSQGQLREMLPDNVRQRQAQEARTRNKAITDNLATDISQAVYEVMGEGYIAEVNSGGQDWKGQGTRRTGSTRHDGGRAADLKVYGPDGQQISQEDYARIGQYFLASGMGSVGMQMARGGIHLDNITEEMLASNQTITWNYDSDGGIPLSRQSRQLLELGKQGVMPELAATLSDLAADGQGTPQTPVSGTVSAARRFQEIKAEQDFTTVSGDISSTRPISPGLPVSSTESYMTVTPNVNPADLSRNTTNVSPAAQVQVAETKSKQLKVDDVPPVDESKMLFVNGSTWV